jgi:hypothetical protein
MVVRKYTAKRRNNFELALAIDSFRHSFGFLRSRKETCRGSQRSPGRVDGIGLLRRTCLGRADVGRTNCSGGPGNFDRHSTADLDRARIDPGEVRDRRRVMDLGLFFAQGFTTLDRITAQGNGSRVDHCNGHPIFGRASDIRAMDRCDDRGDFFLSFFNDRPNGGNRLSPKHRGRVDDRGHIDRRDQRAV